jgi:hypothetical protein
VLVDVIVVVVVVVNVNVNVVGDGDGDELNDASSGRADGHEPICTHSKKTADRRERRVAEPLSTCRRGLRDAASVTVDGHGHGTRELIRPDATRSGE